MNRWLLPAVLSLVAHAAVALLHEAGIPAAVLQLVPGDGASVGAALTRDPRVAGVVFTGSNATALAINSSRAVIAAGVLVVWWRRKSPSAQIRFVGSGVEPVRSDSLSGSRPYRAASSVTSLERYGSGRLATSGSSASTGMCMLCPRSQRSSVLRIASASRSTSPVSGRCSIRCMTGTLARYWVRNSSASPPRLVLVSCMTFVTAATITP